MSIYESTRDYRDLDLHDNFISHIEQEGNKAADIEEMKTLYTLSLD